MKGQPIDQLVYEYMFPKPRASDPQNFQALLQRHLILEVRQEVHSFYGHLETPEAKYPGLDYCHPIHRIRLSRWQWHRRLFRAFDGLRLTPAEIAGLTKWEGTKWAKQRYEKEQGVAIRDTTADGFPDWVEPEDRSAPARSSTRAPTQETEARTEVADEAMDGEASDDDVEIESVGVALNERLRARVAARNAGDMSMPLDEEWEQWLKNAIETGELPLVASQIARLSSERNPAVGPDDIFPPRMVAAARDSRWHEIPDFLHTMLRQSLEAEQNRQTVGSLTVVEATTGSRPEGGAARRISPRVRRIQAAAVAGNGGAAHADPALSEWRRTYSDLRLPAGDGGAAGTSPRVHRTAQPGA